MEGHLEICSQFQPVKDCGRCKDDPAFFNAMRELCDPCEFDYEVAKQKITNLDRIRIADIDRVISWFCRGRLCSTCPYNGVECGIRDWLQKECE